MNQKIINFFDKTEKKLSLYDTDRPKRFVRKPSNSSERSFSRRSQNSDNYEHYIKNPLSNSRVAVNTTDAEDEFFRKIANDLSFEHQKTSVNGLRHRTATERLHLKNKLIQADVLETQLQLKTQECSMLRKEYERNKSYGQEQRQKRKRIQAQKKRVNRELQEANRKVQHLELENKKLQGEKEFLCKQVQFLERINYDDKERTLQSYREEYLAGQISKVKDELRKSRSKREDQLLLQIKNLQENNYTITAELNALKLANECLAKRFLRLKQEIEDSVLNSSQYISLREKYRKFLEEYKKMRNEYWALKNKGSLQKSDTLLSISLQSLVDDESDAQPSPASWLQQSTSPREAIQPKFRRFFNDNYTNQKAR